jgi:enoyl-CoA hydratase
MSALNTTTNPVAQKAREELLKRSPLALKTTLAAIRGARQLKSLEEALNVEFRLCTRLFEGGEFIEGVRALLVDKDRKPKWRPPTIPEVTDAMVAALFAPMRSGEELGLKPPA